MTSCFTTASLPDMAPTYNFTVLGLMVVFSVAGVALLRWIFRRLRSKKD